MAVVGDRRAGCDGCGRTVALEDLTAVTMPDGERVACCPACLPHARRAASAGSTIDQRRERCDGCAGEYLAADLEEVALPDGAVVTCCPSCAAEAPGRGDEGGRERAASAERANRCSQCGDRVAEELFRVTTIDGRSERLCSPCKADADERGVLDSVAMRSSRAREVLGVDADATPEEIRAAYHEQVKRAHPDRKSGSKSAFLLVTDAYERLRDDDQ